MPVILRPAVVADQPAIQRMIRAARLNPLNLHWSNFLVAEDGDSMIGVGQVRPYRDGSRELASIAVVPERQGQGIGSLIVKGLVARETGRLVLICADTNEDFYARFGFRRIASRQLPLLLRAIYGIGMLASLPVRLFDGHSGLVAMARL